MNRTDARMRALRAGVTIALLAACSDVQSVQLGELAASSAGARSAPEDAAAPPNRDAGTAHAPTDRAPMDAGAIATDPGTPDPSPPSAADAGLNRPDARIDARDVDDDDDEDSEESPEPERPREDEDAGEASDD